MKAIEKIWIFGKPCNSIIAFTPLLLFSILITWQCKCDKTGKLVLNKPVKAPVAISFLDANRLLEIQIPIVKVTLIDDGGQVVTPNNLSFSSLEIKGGVMCVALKDSASFSMNDPYRFAIKVEAPGYSTNYRTILVYQDTAQYIPVFMTKIDDPPAGMSGFSGTIPIVDSKIMTNIIITPNTNNKQERKVSVSITGGTVLMSNGDTLKKGARNISYNFTYASPGSLPAMRTFPGANGGTLITDAVDNNGEVIATPGKPFYFISSGWMTLDIRSENKEITDFSKPVDLIMPVGDSLINPITLRPFREGDKIFTWSLNNKNVWKKEGIAEVKSSGDGLIATMSIKHLSFWNLDNSGALCPGIISIPFNNTTGCLLTRYCDIFSSLNGTTPYGLLIGDHQLAFNSGMGHHDIKNAPLTGTLTFKVYDNPTGPGPILASSSFSCGGATPPTLNMTPAAVHSMKLDFRVQDASGQFYAICNNAVNFLPGTLCPAGGAYVYGGILTVAKDPGDNECVGTTTICQISAFTTACIRLFYGNSASGGTVSETVDVVVDFNDISPKHDIQTTITNNGSAPFSPSTLATQEPIVGGFRIIIPGGGGTDGVGIINSCAGCTPGP